MAASRYGRVKLGIAAGTAASLLAGATYLQIGAIRAASSAADLVQADLVMSVAESASPAATTQSSGAVASGVATPQATVAATTAAAGTTDSAARARTSRAS